MKLSVPFLYDLNSIYVADLDEYHQLDETMEGLVDFGSPIAAENVSIYPSTAFAAGERKNFIGSAALVVDINFGRTVNVTCTGVTTVTIFGRDYLNQPMTQTVAGVAGTVATLKAFRFIDAILSSAAFSISLGRGPRLGLPFVASGVRFETLNNIITGVAGTLTVPDLAVPTAATGDTRGTFIPNSAMNGVNDISTTIRFNNDSTGLYGARQA